MTASVPKAPSLLLGVGLGGFIDGIVLHQVLQWHHSLHHVRDDLGAPLGWDLAFIALGVLLVAAGAGAVAHARHTHGSDPRLAGR